MLPGPTETCAFGAKDLDRTRKSFPDTITSNELREFIAKTGVHWPGTQIAQALHRAAIALGSDGWAPIDAAFEWVNEQYPEERPDEYGCKSCRQVIHETGLFDRQNRKFGGRHYAWLLRPPQRLGCCQKGMRPKNPH
ncbi:OST-HTH/LOTUS domain-containing protein [Pseudotabrizicola alkalilacus]|uniref:Uncharacterized protein n=1 Tax=Pseudotabrizicola alkalilacus TaxID=2305252 RepID=A0A411YW81_9RHOB|nr:OST-HTH/LOTUS domain-containing protein [Pseudotabrizicola alkalilacus]RGP35144.1 hypothetical protein D1012_21510 [Pseudotabrizicola alkalilacus]